MNKIVQTITSCRNCNYKEDNDHDLWCGASGDTFYLGDADAFDYAELPIPDKCPLLLSQKFNKLNKVWHVDNGDGVIYHYYKKDREAE